MDYEREDKIALERALLGMHVCPRCRRDLLPAAPYWGDHVWICRPCHESWYIEPLARPGAQRSVAYSKGTGLEQAGAQ